MKARIIRIGNSRGIRISGAILKLIGADNEVDITVQGNALIIRPVHKPRAGWEAAFREMKSRGDDDLNEADDEWAT
jgi:antitoxin MazE